MTEFYIPKILIEISFKKCHGIRIYIDVRKQSIETEKVMWDS